MADLPIGRTRYQKQNRCDSGSSCWNGKYGPEETARRSEYEMGKAPYTFTGKAYEVGPDTFKAPPSKAPPYEE